MRILLIRHGDPDYIHDALTEKGRREADCLSRIVPDLHVGECYVSPMGRAQETCRIALQHTDKKAKTEPWLMEFLTNLNLNRHPELREAYGEDTPRYDPERIKFRFRKDESYTAFLHPEEIHDYEPDAEGVLPVYAPRIVWDLLPSYYMEHRELRDPENWRNSDIARADHISEYYDYVTKGFDGMLAEHGYVRSGDLYRVEKENADTVTCFCHLGLSDVLISHLFNISPFVIWQSFAQAPTSVTELVSEEREQGTAFFRCLRFGDTTHLTMGNEKPSLSGRFCERFSDDTRH